MKSDLYKKAIEKWGKASQLDMVIEELSELLQAVCKVKRRGDRWPPCGDIESLAEEVADVEIMLGQLKEMFDCGDTVDRWRDEKLLRLARMLGEGKRCRTCKHYNGIHARCAKHRYFANYYACINAGRKDWEPREPEPERSCETCKNGWRGFCTKYGFQGAQRCRCGRFWLWEPKP